MDFHKTVNEQFAEILKLGKKYSGISANSGKNHMYGLEQSYLLMMQLQTYMKKKIFFFNVGIR